MRTAEEIRKQREFYLKMLAVEGLVNETLRPAFSFAAEVLNWVMGEKFDPFMSRQEFLSRYYSASGN